jgi:hypothetical protein
LALVLSLTSFILTSLLYVTPFLPKDQKPHMTDAGFGALGSPALALVCVLPLSGLIGAAVGVGAAIRASRIVGKPGKRRASAAMLLGLLSVVVPCIGFKALAVRDAQRARADAELERIRLSKMDRELVRRITTYLLDDARKNGEFMSYERIPKDIQQYVSRYEGAGLRATDELYKKADRVILFETGIMDGGRLRPYLVFVDGHVELSDSEATYDRRNESQRIRKDLP